MTRREILVEYLKSCVTEEDWHGVVDAAIDLGELDAEERIRREVFLENRRC